MGGIWCRMENLGGKTEVHLAAKGAACGTEGARGGHGPSRGGMRRVAGTEGTAAACNARWGGRELRSRGGVLGWRAAGGLKEARVVGEVRAAARRNFLGARLKSFRDRV